MIRDSKTGTLSFFGGGLRSPRWPVAVGSGLNDVDRSAANEFETRRASKNRIPALFTAIALWLFAAPVLLPAAEIADTRAKLEAKFAADLTALAEWCDQHQLPAEAKHSREWIVRREPRKLYVFVLPDALTAPANMGENAVLAQWWERWTTLRRAEADALFELAGKAIEDHRPALAYELIRQTVREFPDHERARVILGYEKLGGRWASAYAAHRLAAGEVFDEQFGWLPAADVARYKRGERKNLGAWITAEQDARRHASIKTGWRIETEHYVVVTDHSLEAGVRLAQKLERLNETWRQEFIPYYMTEAELAKRYRGTPLPQHDAKQHQAFLFRNRDEYVAAGRVFEPMIDRTIAYYWRESRAVYFFPSDDQSDGTLYHEATHQLFQEMRTTVRDPGHKNNFWVVEAIACYMESLGDRGGYFTLGGAEEGRMPAAMQRVLDANFYVPLAELIGFDRDAMQHDSRLPKLYSQSAGLASFLMHYDGGRYRPPLMNYLVAVYSDHADADTLAKLTGASYQQLDQQYREYMKQLASGE